MSEHIGYSQVEDRFGFYEKGTFRCPRKNEPLLLAIVAAIYAVYLCVVVINGVIVLTGDLSVPIYEYDRTIDDYVPTLNLLCVIISVLILVIFTIIAVFAMIVITSGNTYTFFADETKMIITDPKGEKTELRYSDIISITYEKLTLFTRRQRGFDVYIETKYRTLNYQYIYSKNKLLQQEKDSPFFILEEHAGLKKRRYSDDMGA